MLIISIIKIIRIIRMIRMISIGIEITVKSLEEVVKVIILIINYPPSFPSNSKYIVLTTSSKPNS